MPELPPSPRPPGSAPSDGTTNSNQPPRANRPWWQNIWWLLAIIILVWNIATIFAQRQSTVVLDLSYSDFLSQVRSGNVSEVSFQGTAITGTFKKAITYPPPNAAASSASPSGSANASASASGASAGAQAAQQSQTSTHFTTQAPSFGDPALLPLLKSENVNIKVNPNTGPAAWVVILENLLPWLAFGALLYFLSRRAGQSQQSIFGFGRSKAKLYANPEVRITFADVAGVDEAKKDLEDIIDFLRDPARYQRLGGRIPRGVLLVGPPGTGKTLLAKAVAGEANVPFFSISGPEFVEVLVGVGASRVRDLFEQAKKQGPSIVFVDEIDAVGRKRGAGSYGGSNEEREQTLNQILVEMDGFDATHTVVVIAATNRADVLDPALLRPGRFDRQVSVDRPDRNGRLAILHVHAKAVPLGQDVDLAEVARATAGMTGADLANLVNEAALLGAKRSLEAVNQQCFWDALEKIQLGAERPLVLTADDRRIVAYHEAGHALIALLSPNADPLNRVTIIPRGRALGVTLQLPIDDRYNYSRAYLMTRIAVALGGRIAEMLVFGDITTGAENDLEMVTSLVRQMVTRWGMSEQVGVLVQSNHEEAYLGGMLSPRETSEFLARQVDSAMQEIVAERYAFTQDLMSRNRDKLEKLAGLLLEHESVNANQIRKELGLTQEQMPSTKRVVAAASSRTEPL